MAPDEEKIGESWEISVVPSSTSVIANGTYRGEDLASVIRRDPNRILGNSVARKYDKKLPLLFKFIDAETDLSIQVHPDNEMAMREHGQMGKTEMWYIIDTKPDASLYVGFKEKISPDEYKRRVGDATITDVLAKHSVKPGDVFYIPAGRIHAICGGILLAEIQQSSDITYRIYDYDRPGNDGKKRELHTELAAKAIDYSVEKEYRTLYDTPKNGSNLVIDTPYFTAKICETATPIHQNLIKYDSFIVLMCLQGECHIRICQSGETILLKMGHSCLIPAAIAEYDIIPTPEKGPCRILDAFINNKKRSLLRTVTRFLHITKK